MCISWSGWHFLLGWLVSYGREQLYLFFLPNTLIKLIINRKTSYSYALYNGNLKTKSKASTDFCIHFSFKFNAKHIRNVVVGGTDADCDAGQLPFLFCPISPSS